MAAGEVVSWVDSKWLRSDLSQAGVASGVDRWKYIAFATVGMLLGIAFIYEGLRGDYYRLFREQVFLAAKVWAGMQALLLGGVAVIFGMAILAASFYWGWSATVSLEDLPPFELFEGQQGPPSTVSTIVVRAPLLRSPSPQSDTVALVEPGLVRLFPAEPREPFRSSGYVPVIVTRFGEPRERGFVQREVLCDQAGDRLRLERAKAYLDPDQFKKGAEDGLIAFFIAVALSFTGIRFRNNLGFTASIAAILWGIGTSGMWWYGVIAPLDLAALRLIVGLAVALALASLTTYISEDDIMPSLK